MSNIISHSAITAASTNNEDVLYNAGAFTQSFTLYVVGSKHRAEQVREEQEDVDREK